MGGVEVGDGVVGEIDLGNRRPAKGSVLGDGEDGLEICPAEGGRPNGARLVAEPRHEGGFQGHALGPTRWVGPPGVGKCPHGHTDVADRRGNGHRLFAGTGWLCRHTICIL